MGVDKINRVVVLMLENRSFDHMLGALDGVDGASPNHTNTSKSGEVFTQTARDNFVLPIQLDPKHEFKNVQTQLGPPGPVRAMSGFVIDGQDTARDLDDYADLPTDADRRAVVQSVMDYFNKGSLPALHRLAAEFAVCDRWFASVPGPTWPNRFFAMMGSCHGQLEMPVGMLSVVTAVRAIAAQIGKESIFSVLGDGQHRIYSDYLVPLSVLLKGADERASLADFEDQAAHGTLPAFCWIEPDYSSDLERANSQHPPENVLRGDNLIARVYNALRASDAVWNETLLVIVHDEHGGFYDHVPPAPTQSADDQPSHPAFDYATTGVRVPCVLVSPWVQRGTLSEVYDHTSLLAFVCDRFNRSDRRAALGRRVEATMHFGSAPIWSDEARTDVPDQLPMTAILQTFGEEASADLDDLLPKLLVALDAHADPETALAPAFRFDEALPGQPAAAVRVGTRVADDARIAAAWNKVGKLDDEQVRAMLSRVKQTFNQ